MKDWKREEIIKRKKEIVIHLDYELKFHHIDFTIFQRARILYFAKLNLEREINNKTRDRESAKIWTEHIISNDVSSLQLHSIHHAEAMQKGGTIT